MTVKDDPRVAVVGHIEWVHFIRVPALPAAGAIAHAQAYWSEAAGGGGVAAVQLARLAGGGRLFTALGDDDHGRRSVERMAELGVRCEAAVRDAPTRRAVTFLDGDGERTITTLGARLAPEAADALPWDSLSACDGIYFTAGDVGALRAARAARVLVATPRARDALVPEVELDALVLSAHDEGERALAERLGASAAALVMTEGRDGGSWRTRDGASGRWTVPPPPGPGGDAYGCGDSFAAGLTYGLAAGMGLDDAVVLAARCGAECRSGSGPYEHQLARGAI